MSALQSTLSSAGNTLMSLATAVILMWLFCWVSLIAHELGHYFAGRLVGVRAEEIRLGSGRIWRLFQWGRVRWIVHRHPISGWVARFNQANRFQHATLILGGPAATAMLAFGLWWLYWNPPAPPHSRVVTEFMGLCQMFAMMEIAGLCVTLWPAHYHMHGQRVRNDGLLLWHTLFPPPVSQAPNLYAEALQALQAGEPDKAARLAREAAQTCEPGDHDDAQEALAYTLAEAGRAEEAAAVYREVLGTMKPDHPHFPRFADGLASLALYRHLPDLYVESEAMIRKALEAHPRRLTLKGTLGGLLVERGCDAEALPLLQELHARGEDETDLGISAAYLSVLATRRGDAAGGAKLQKEAMTLLPEHPLVRRVLGFKGDAKVLEAASESA
jgi:hypothetical protein